MSIPNLTTRQLEQLLVLNRRKEALRAEIEGIDRQMAGYLGEKRGASAQNGTLVHGARPGGLKQKILSALESAGPEGSSIKEISGRIHVNRKNVEIWFYTTGKRIDGLVKVAPGRFALKGSNGTSASPERSKRGRKASRKRRGGAKATILAALKAAGKVGCTVKELSKTLGMKNQNLHTWFNQTGRKVPGLRRIGVGRYRLG